MLTLVHYHNGKYWKTIQSCNNHRMEKRLQATAEVVACRPAVNLSLQASAARVPSTSTGRASHIPVVMILEQGQAVTQLLQLG